MNVELVELTPEDQLENEIEKAEKIQRLMRIRKVRKGPSSEHTVQSPNPTRCDPDPTRPDPNRRAPEPTRSDPDPTRRDPDPTRSDPDPTRHDPDPTVCDPDSPRTLDPPAVAGAVASSKVKLPKISLPCFKGNPVYWIAFWDSYESAVHLNSALSDVDKFNYLRSLLEKSAYDAIAGLTLVTKYTEVIEILKKRFGNQ